MFVKTIKIKEKKTKKTREIAIKEVKKANLSDVAVFLLYLILTPSHLKHNLKP